MNTFKMLLEQSFHNSVVAGLTMELIFFLRCVLFLNMCVCMCVYV